MVIVGVSSFGIMAQIPKNNSSNNEYAPAQGKVALPLYDSTDSKDAVKYELPVAPTNRLEHEKQIQLFNTVKENSRKNLESRSPTVKQQSELLQLYQNANKNLPSDPINGAMFYDLNNYNASNSFLLDRAIKAKPNDRNLLELWAANAFVVGDSVNLISRMNLLDSLGFFPKDVQCYAHDVVSSTPSNSLLVTHGRWDSFGVAQELIKNTNSEIVLVSLEFLQSPQYRKLLELRGITVPEQPTVDVAFFQAFVNANPTKKFAFSMTIPKAYLVPFQNELVPLGLVFMYPNSFDEEFILEKNQALMKSLHYLDCGNEADAAFESLKDNYLPMIETVEQLSDKVSKEERSTIDAKKSKIKKRKAPER